MIINLLLKYLALFARLGAILSDGLISSVTTAIFKIFTIIPLIYAGFTCKKKIILAKYNLEWKKIFLISILSDIIYNLLQEEVLHASDCVVDP